MEHRAEILWVLEGDFRAGAYSRRHELRFDGGVTVPASASPDIVPLPHSVVAAVDPEEAFVASIASCHMLWFLDLARRDGHIVGAYRDAAVGRLTRNAAGDFWVSEVTLNVSVEWQGPAPDHATHEALHHRAHKACFIANSVRTDITTNIIEGQAT